MGQDAEFLPLQVHNHGIVRRIIHARDFTRSILVHCHIDGYRPIPVGLSGFPDIFGGHDGSRFHFARGDDPVIALAIFLCAAGGRREFDISRSGGRRGQTFCNFHSAREFPVSSHVVQLIGQFIQHIVCLIAGPQGLAAGKEGNFGIVGCLFDDKVAAVDFIGRILVNHRGIAAVVSHFNIGILFILVNDAAIGGELIDVGYAIVGTIDPLHMERGIRSIGEAGHIDTIGR